MDLEFGTQMFCSAQKRYHEQTSQCGRLLLIRETNYWLRSQCAVSSTSHTDHNGNTDSYCFGDAFECYSSRL